MRIGKKLAAVAMLAALATGAQAQNWPLWEAYCHSFVDPQGRVIDHQGGDRTTSEGESYAMFFAVVANDRPRFEKLLSWTRDNLAHGDMTAHRPGWEWGKAPDGQWKLLDANSASDADLWMCYSLAEAGRLWKVPSYTALARVMAARIAQEEVVRLPGFGPMLLPGTDGFHPAAQTWLLNPSYVPLPVLLRLAELDPAGPWKAIASHLPQFLRDSSPRGFPMDWVTYSPGTGFRPAGAPGKSGKATASPTGSFDAIRVYLWAGISNPADAQTRPVLSAVGGMATLLDARLFPPEYVSAQGAPGKNDGPVGFSAAVIPYLIASGKPYAHQADRLTAELDSATRLYGHPPAYFDQNLAMFAQGWQEHLFRFESDGELRVAWKN